MKTSLPPRTDTPTAPQRIRGFLRWVQNRPDLDWQLSVYQRSPEVTFVFNTADEADPLVDQIPFTQQGDWASNGQDAAMGAMYGTAWGIRVCVIARDRYPAASTRVGAVV